MGDLVELFESQGVRTGSVLLPANISGLTLLNDKLDIFIVINSNHPALRRRFSLAHEYAHVLIDRDRANAFAAEFLMPAEGILQFVHALGTRPFRPDPPFHKFMPQMLGCTYLQCTALSGYGKRRCANDDSRITMKAKNHPSASEGEKALYELIRKLIVTARQTVTRGVDLVQVHTNFEIGRHIIENEQQGEQRAAYGKAILKSLAEKLSVEFGPGFSVTNLKLMRQFYIENIHR